MSFDDLEKFEFTSNELEKLELASNDTPFFSLTGLETKAKCVKCYDGDTVHLVFLYNQKLCKWSCRLSGINTPEIRTKNIEEKKSGLQAKQFLEDQILDKIIDISIDDLDKYGRLLVTIKNNKGCNINELMVMNGYAIEYHGGKKESFHYKNE